MEEQSWASVLLVSGEGEEGPSHRQRPRRRLRVERAKAMAQREEAAQLLDTCSALLLQPPQGHASGLSASVVNASELRAQHQAHTYTGSGSLPRGWDCAGRVITRSSGGVGGKAGDSRGWQQLGRSRLSRSSSDPLALSSSLHTEPQHPPWLERQQAQLEQQKQVEKLIRMTLGGKLGESLSRTCRASEKALHGTSLVACTSPDATSHRVSAWLVREHTCIQRRRAISVCSEQVVVDAVVEAYVRRIRRRLTFRGEHSQGQALNPVALAALVGAHIQGSSALRSPSQAAAPPRRLDLRRFVLLNNMSCSRRRLGA